MVRSAGGAGRHAPRDATGKPGGRPGERVHAMSPGYRLGVLNGDGIGPEVVPAALRAADAALDAVGAPPPEWITLTVGQRAIEDHGEAISDETLDRLATLDGWLLGPHDSAAYPEPHRSQL